MTESLVFNPQNGTLTEYEKAYRWGEFFHVVTLKDGRNVGLSADKVVVTDNGDFIALSTAVLDESTMNRIPFSTPKTVLSLAKGEWISFYSASAMTGDPLGVEWTESIKE